MARLESQMKGGFYPTPPEVIETIAKLIRIEAEQVSILDPCCGDGQAAFSLKKELLRRNKGIKITTYGIELNEERAGKARRVLDKVVCGDAFNVTVQPSESFDIVFLNPPYDAGGEGERLEMRFVREAEEKWIKRDGILILIVPQYILARKDIARYLGSSYLFSYLSIFRFPSEFKQVVIMCVKQTDYGNNSGVIMRIGEGKEEFLNPLEKFNDLLFPLWLPIEEVDDRLSEALRKYYVVYQSIGKPEVFTSKNLRPEDVIEWSESTPLLERFRKLTEERKESEKFTPLMTLRKGHLIQAIVSGALNGKFRGKGGEEILLKGAMKKTKEVVEIDESPEELKEVKRERFRVFLRYFDSSGELKEVML